MSRPLSTCLYMLCFIFLLQGCKQEPRKKPDHVIQQEARKKEKAQAAKNKKSEVKKAKAKHEAKAKKEDAEELSWPGPVRLAFYNLYTAKIPQWPASARRLALMGLPAVPAMKRLLQNKRQPVKKKALVSFLYVQLHVFRPQALTMLARDEDLPFTRRGAIEALANIGNAQTKKALAAIRHELENAPRPKAAPKKKAHGHAGHGHEGHGHGTSGAVPREALTRPFGPIIDFIDRSQKVSNPCGYDAKQLAVLYSVFHAESQMKLKVALDWVKDDSVEAGLVSMLRSPVTRPQIHTALIKRMVVLAMAKPKKLRDYCEPGFPQMLRMLSAKKLLDGKKPSDRAYLQKLASNPRDPMSSFLKAILSGKMPGMVPR